MSNTSIYNTFTYFVVHLSGFEIDILSTRARFLLKSLRYKNINVNVTFPDKVEKIFISAATINNFYWNGYSVL